MAAVSEGPVRKIDRTLLGMADAATLDELENHRQLLSALADLRAAGRPKGPVIS